MRVSTDTDRRGRFVDSVEKAAQALREGTLVAFPTETVYGLGAHAFDAAAVARVFEFKGRPPTDPLIVHVADPAAAESLVELGAPGRLLMRKLAASFWPGPLTLVAPAGAQIPPAVTASTGWVGVRCPAHKRALELLRAVDAPVVAPSANRFGHISPTRPEHVMEDLGAHPLLVLRAEDDSCCDVGIESTVAKIDEASSTLVVLRRGGIPEAELHRWIAEHGDGFSLQVAAAHQPAATPDAAPAAPMIAPGMLLTHYAPDMPSYLLRLPATPATRAASDAPDGPLEATLRTAALIDFGGRAAAFAPTAHAYRDLSPAADASMAATALFEALRWAEASAAQCVLLPDVLATEVAARSADCLPALADRLFRAASGRAVRLDADGILAPVAER